MRFDSQEHLDAFKKLGRFPGIHDDFERMFVEEARVRRWVDLCCNTGLLGERLRRRHGVYVCGIEGDADAVQRGTEAGIAYERLLTRIDSSTLPTVLLWLKERRVEGVAARRCLSELFFDAALRAPLAAVLVSGTLWTLIAAIAVRGMRGLR